MIVPPPPDGKPAAFTDTECFPNYWLLKIGVHKGPVFSFSLRSGQSFDDNTIQHIDYLLSLFTLVTFNGNYYDIPLIGCALMGYSCEQLKWVSDQIIKEQRKHWELGINIGWRPVDHIDVMEVLPGAGSQKQYAGRIHCKTMRDLPYDPETWLSESEIVVVDSYCENDLLVLEDLYLDLEPQRVMRDHLSKRYGIDLRSKSDAQLAEAVIKRRCEDAMGFRIYKPEIDWSLKFRYEPPAWLTFQDERLRAAFELIKQSIFALGPSGAVIMPAQLEGLEIPLGKTIYRLGIGGLHSKDERTAHFSDETYSIRDVDVASYYPNLILNSGKYPAALGPVFLEIFRIMKDERLLAKNREKTLKKIGDSSSMDFQLAHVENEGGKIMINGTFGKTGSPFSILFAPEMLIQTTVTGQLALLMLIEWHEIQGIRVISANTDGMLIKCERSKIPVSENIVSYWQKVTGLEMETTEYQAIYTRDVNNYIAIKTDGEIKRKGEYSTSGLIEKKNPDVEICGDAVAEFLSKGVPILYTIAVCRDIRKFVKIRQVAGGAVKLWGEGPREVKVRDMTATLESKGWWKAGRKWMLNEIVTDATTAYKKCFKPQIPEYLAKVVRWYYSTEAPGPIVYNNSGNMVSLSYGARPCMVLPDKFPADIDYGWYVENCEKMLRDVGFYDAQL